MSDVLISVLFAAIAGGFATFAIWSLRRLQDDVHETADLDRRVSRLERMAWPNWLQDKEGDTPTTLTEAVARIQTALGMLHQPEHLWQCPCCTATRAALKGETQ